MSFLDKHWSEIVGIKAQEGMPESYVASTGAKGFMRPWVHDNINMEQILAAIRILQPKKVLELGTFEAFGTIRIAKEMSSYSENSNLYTFDVGDAPANSLGTHYGCASTFEAQKVVDWEDIDTSRTSADIVNGWRSWGEVMKVRDERLSEDFPGVEIKFVQGLTFNTLPKVMRSIKTWDFCFQDTLHTYDHMWKEWVLFRNNAKVGSVVVFDDVDERNWPFVERFNDNQPGWLSMHTPVGHGQFWAERVE